MLSFFKINDPFRLVPLALLVFLIKLPVFLNPIQYAEASHWFLIGEAMQSGYMYKDIWDGLGPFSASVYMVFTWLFERSTLTLLILGTVLTYFQAIIINNFSIRAKLYESNTYLPALVYILLTSSHPSFFSLSPSLMGLTFILLGLGKLLSHVEFRAKNDMHIILIGLYFGISVLFHFPYIIIIPISLLLLGLFSNTVLRRYFLLLFTSFTPMIAAYFYYWLKSDHPVYFIYNFILFNNFDVYYLNIGWRNGAIILFMALFFTAMGIISFGKQRRLTNYQFRVVQLFFILGILMMPILLLEKPITQYSLVVFVPIAAYFTVHFISLFKKPMLSTVLSFILFLSPVTILIGTNKNWFPQINTTPDSSSLDYFKTMVKNKRVMVLGSAKSLYKNAELAGPFYDWGLSKPFFKELDYYDNLIFLQEQLTKSRPEVIIDLENNWTKISKRLPAIGKNYYLSQPNVWVRKN